MSRVKKGSIRKKSHKKIINLSKGYINRRGLTYRISKEAVIKSLTYSYNDRKIKKRFFKSF